MSNPSYDEQSLPDEIYSPPSVSKKYILLFIAIFPLLALFFIPWGTLLKTPNLSQILGCPIQHTPLSANFFPPGVYFKNITLPPACTGMSNMLNLQDLVIGIGGISFSPLGPVVNIKGNLDQFPIQAKLAVGLNQISLSSYYEKLSLNKLNHLLNKMGSLPVTFEGNVKLDARFSLLNQQIDEYRLDITSQDLNLPSQMITFFKVPELPLKTLNIKIQGKKNKLSIDNITIGSNNNLYFNAKGNMLLDFQMFANSQLNLDSELKLSHALNQEFSILSNFIGKNKVAEGQYKMKISGTLASPVF
jgi:type II secretion system protein N